MIHYSHLNKAPGTAFTISFDDNTDDLVQKNPPKRLQRLETNRSLSSSSNIEELEEKLATAETRRQQVWKNYAYDETLL